MKYPSATLKILAVCLSLQVLQSYFPSLVYHQVFVAHYAANLKTIPLFLLGLIVHMFSHAGWEHLLGNMFLGIPCMLLVENRLGSKGLADSFVLCGVAAALVQSLMPFAGEASIGSSGAVFGLFALACGLYGRTVLESALLMGLLALGLIPQLQSLNLAFLAPGIAFGAYIGGIVCGLVLALLHYKHPSDELSPPQPLQ